MEIRRLDVSGIPGTNGYCDETAVNEINKRMDAGGITPSGVRYLGSGNYHYLSFLVTNRIEEPYTLVVFDHHPDMRAPAFGDILSCGGWVREVLKKQPLCRKVVLIGVDEGLLQAELEALREEEAEMPGEEETDALQKKDMKTPFGITDRISTVKATGEDGPLCRGEASGEKSACELSVRLRQALPENRPVFLSIDLDVLSEDEVKTDWDQGDMTLQELLRLLNVICESRRVIGVDICGAPD